MRMLLDMEGRWVVGDWMGWVRQKKVCPDWSVGSLPDPHGRDVGKKKRLPIGWRWPGGWGR